MGRTLLAERCPLSGEMQHFLSIYLPGCKLATNGFKVLVKCDHGVWFITAAALMASRK
jgi:hypothetical protein